MNPYIKLFEEYNSNQKISLNGIEVLALKAADGTIFKRSKGLGFSDDSGGEVSVDTAYMYYTKGDWTPFIVKDKFGKEYELNPIKQQKI